MNSEMLIDQPYITNKKTVELLFESILSSLVLKAHRYYIGINKWGCICTT